MKCVFDMAWLIVILLERRKSCIRNILPFTWMDCRPELLKWQTYRKRWLNTSISYSIDQTDLFQTVLNGIAVGIGLNIISQGNQHFNGNFLYWNFERTLCLFRWLVLLMFFQYTVPAVALYYGRTNLCIYIC